ncbi:MAG: ketoacyl-ACP synthase III [Anaerolineae bacterium]
MYVPDSILTNEDLAAIIDTSDEWIQSRTGIRERHIANDRETTARLGLRAAQRALAVTDILPQDIELIVVATSTPEHIFPSTASLIQHWLGASNAGAFDLSAACSGFVYGVDMAAQAIRSGSITTALVIGSETMSRVLDWTDRSTCILFGDGAGAIVLQARETEGGVLSSVLKSDGSGYDLLAIPAMGNPDIRSNGALHDRRLHKMYMAGGEVFRFATRVVGESILQAVEKAGITLEDVKLIIPHQANERIIKASARSLNLSADVFVMNLDRYGNTSAASIPIALYEAVQQGRVTQGDYIVFVGFGGGLTWASMVVKWGIPVPEDRNINRLREQRRQAGYLFVRIQTAWRNLTRRLRAVLPGSGRDRADLP